jgi:hypothetical protein
MLWMHNIIHVAGRVSAGGAITPPGNLETMRSVRFAILTEEAKQKQRRLKRL